MSDESGRASAKVRRAGKRRGRPKGAIGKKKIVQKIAKERHKVKFNGEQRSVTTVELIFQKVLALHVRGDLRATKLLDEAWHQLEPGTEQGGGYVVVPEGPPTMEEFEKALEEYREYIARIERQAREEWG